MRSEDVIVLLFVIVSVVYFIKMMFEEDERLQQASFGRKVLYGIWFGFLFLLFGVVIVLCFTLLPMLLF